MQPKNRDIVNQLGKDARIVRYGTILPTEGALMQEHHESVRKNFTKFTYRHNLSNKQASKGIGLSAPVLSQWLSNTYRGDNDNVAKRVNRWMEMEARKLDVRLELPYMPTDVAEAIRSVIQTAHEHTVMAAIVAPAGSGKSIVAKVMAEEMNGFYIYADQDMTIKSFLDQLVVLTKANPKGATVDALKRAVIDVLHESGRPIFVDEAQLMRPQLFSRLRSIHDQAKVPIIMLGAFEILSRIDDRASGRGQMARRTIQWNALEYFANVEDPRGGSLGRPLYTIEQVKALFAHMPVKLTDAGMEMLWSIACLHDRGCLGTAKYVMDMAYRAFGGERSVGLDEIEVVLSTFFGTQANTIVNKAKEHRRRFREAAA